VVRSAYGYLWLAKSRFSPAEELNAHMSRIVRVLKEVARIAEDEGTRIAIENHVDFTGPQWAQMLTAVDSPAIRSGLDTGNALAIFADPAADVAALAPLTISVQIKDMGVVESGSTDVLGPTSPFRIAGCALGDGVVDVPGAIERVLRDGELGDQTPFHLEISWPQCPPGRDPREVAAEMLERGVGYLRAYPVDSSRSL
jgi:sugar phosphate isomerase/epimerase